MISLRNAVRNQINNVAYSGKIKAVIFDLAGTVCDPGVFAPVTSFTNTFKKHNIHITMNEARKDIGIRKDKHIEKILQIPRIQQEWLKEHKREYTQYDVIKIYKDYIDIQKEMLKVYSSIVPNADQVFSEIRHRGIKIGCTTGYTKILVNNILPELLDQNVYFDHIVAGDEVSNGNRPGPFMLYRNLEMLNIPHIQSVIKVDDTVSGIQEGINAGCWTVGVYKWSNYTNYNTYDEMNRISSDQRLKKEFKAKQILADSKAHYVIPDISYLHEVIEDINKRMNEKEQPTDSVKHFLCLLT